MSCAAVFVDAGYIFAQGSVLLTGTRQRRELLTLELPAVVAALSAAVAEQCRLPLLRIYWYDAMVLGRPTPEQMALADAADIKIRLGQVNAAGEQKGVDALIVTDMVELARNHAISDAVLVSGDEDVRVGVVLAQQFGVRVHLVGIHPARANQSRSLRQEADTTVEWDAAAVARFLRLAAVVPSETPAGQAATAALDRVIAPLVAALAPEEAATLKAQWAINPQIPRELDRARLRAGRAHFGQSTLSAPERAMLRDHFGRMLLTR
ncbi:MAG: NYN domain-containing protein [Acetobacteraceae bacterium]